MTVVHVHPTHVPTLVEGISRNVVELCDGLRREGADVRLDALATDLAGLNHRRTLLLQALEGRRAALAAANDPATRLVHYHVGLLATAAPVARAYQRRRPGVPLLVHAWNALLDGPTRPRSIGALDWAAHRAFNGPAAARWTLAAASDVVVSSRYQARQLARLRPACRVHVVPNGVDAQRFRPVRVAEGEAARRRLGVDGDPVVLYYGHASGWKGLGVLLEAMPAVLREHPRAQLLLATTDYGRGRQWLQSRLERKGLRPRTVCLGATDVPRLLAAADVAVVPAVGAVGTAAFPNVLLECLAAGVATVATRVGCVPEAVESGRTGLLARPGDPRSLALAISRLAGDPALRRELGGRARQHMMDRFSWRGAAQAMAAVYAGIGETLPTDRRRSAPAVLEAAR